MLLHPINSPNKDYLLLGTNIGMYVYDVTNEAAIVLISFNSSLPSTGFQVYDQASKLIVSYLGTMIIFDITNFPAMI
jgi:hypothetical protein